MPLSSHLSFTPHHYQFTFFSLSVFHLSRPCDLFFFFSYHFSYLAYLPLSNLSHYLLTFPFLPILILILFTYSLFSIVILLFPPFPSSIPFPSLLFCSYRRSPFFGNLCHYLVRVLLLFSIIIILTFFIFVCPHLSRHSFSSFLIPL